jgi:predicted nuclease with TOPRIM domain
MMAGTGKDAGVASLLIANENLRKDLLMKDNEVVKLRKLLEERDRKLDDAVTFRTSATRELDQLNRELQRAQKEVGILRSEKSALDAANTDNAAYIRKLEARLTSGGKDYLLEQNVKLKASVQQLASEKDAAVATGAAQKAELERAMREIEVLVRAGG